VYDNYRFVDQKELRDLNLDHLPYDDRGKGILRPYMHGYFVPQRLYEQARLLANPDLASQQRQRSIREKIDKERESRIRGNKKVQVKVNRKLAEKLAAREEANERRKAQRLLRKQGTDVQESNAVDTADDSHDHPAVARNSNENTTKHPQKSTTDLIDDDRFKGLFEDEDFEIDETSREFQLHNPSSTAVTNGREGSNRKGLTAVEEEDLDNRAHSSGDDNDDNDDNDDEDESVTLSAQQRQRGRGTEDDENADQRNRIGSASYKKSGHLSRNKTKQKDQRQKAGPRMLVSSSSSTKPKPHQRHQERRERAFGELASSLPSRGSDGYRQDSGGRAMGGIVGEKQVSFVPSKKSSKKARMETEGVERAGGKRQGGSGRDRGRRSASGNVMRQL
jgi:ribosome biogenesis protein ENP2